MLQTSCLYMWLLEIADRKSISRLWMFMDFEGRGVGAPGCALAAPGPATLTVHETCHGFRR